MGLPAQSPVGGAKSGRETSSQSSLNKSASDRSAGSLGTLDADDPKGSDSELFTRNKFDRVILFDLS